MNKTGNPFGKFMLLWSGQLVSAIGSGLSSFGLGVFVFGLTGKASAVALVTLFAFMPGLLLSAISGVLADRYDRRLLMVLGDSLSALGLVFILVCMLRGDVQLWQIYLGVTVSSVFSSLLDPAYKATVTDLLTPEQFTKASGFVQLAGSAKFLISPVIAGFLLTVSDIKLLLLLDICTFFVTVTSTLVVRKGLASQRNGSTTSFSMELKEGWAAVSQNRGVLVLVIIASVITFFLGFIQTLSTPLVLAFSDSAALGTIITIAASGMLVTSVVVGILPIKKGYVRLLAVSLFFAGLGMAAFGMRENMVWISAAGFFFFSMLPFANASLDFLTRTNIENSKQGRAWGLIGLISQLGYVAAYALSGVLADYVFNPLLADGGALAGSIGRLIGTGAGRGTGLLIMVAGGLLCLTAIVLYQIKSVRRLETGGV